MTKLLSGIILLLFATSSASGYKILYAEQFYRLYHRHLYQYPMRTAENIWYLEQALRADFANPLNALAKIENERDWERYRYLFTMHVHVKLVELYLTWGSKYDKMVAYFFNAPWRDANLRSLDKAETLYRYALVYWAEARKWSEKAAPLRPKLPDIQYWIDENYRIQTGDLDYEKIINRHLARLQAVRARFEAMDETTY